MCIVGIPSMHKLVQYFQTLHRNEDIYELKGVHIANFEVGLFSSSVEYCSISNVNSYQCSCKQCCAVEVYAMCYSVINPNPRPNIRSYSVLFLLLNNEIIQGKPTKTQRKFKQWPLKLVYIVYPMKACLVVKETWLWSWKKTDLLWVLMYLARIPDELRTLFLSPFHMVIRGTPRPNRFQSKGITFIPQLF